MNTTLSLLYALSLLRLDSSCVQAPDAAVIATRSTNFQLPGDVQTLSFTMVREFPFVSAEINGVKGKLMFDTGGGEALSLNDHLLPLGSGKPVGSGVFGSGQTYTVTSHPTIERVSLGDRLFYRNVMDVNSQNLNFMEQSLTPDFLGFLGFKFFEGYLLKLDYAKGRLTFYKATAKRRVSQDFLRGETVLAVLPFEVRKLPNHPLIHLKIGTEEFIGAFDTGQMGGAQMSTQTQQVLQEQHLLIPADDKTLYQLRGLHLTNTLDTSLSGIRLSNQPGPANAPIGITEPNVLTLGYAFLSQYKTVWDPADKKIYILKK